MTPFLLAAVILLTPTTSTTPTPDTPPSFATRTPDTAPAPAHTPRTAPARTPDTALASAHTPRTAPAITARTPAATPVFTPLTAAPAQPGAVWPLSPRPEVVRGFEPPPKPWLPGHRGLDLRGSPGQLVRSATSGTVTYAGPLAGRGVIVITNGPLRTTYEPVIPTVRAGTLVTPGTPLGQLSAAASHCAPATCLHWGLLQSSNYLNPLSLLPTRPVRLLPNAPLAPTRSGPPTPLTDGAPPPQVDPPTPIADGAPLAQVDPPAANPPGSPPPRGIAPPADITAGELFAASHSQPADPAASPPHASPTPDLEAQSSPQGGLASGVIVGLAATATLIGSLLIRRH
jgi:hypothetical protein